MDTPTRSDGATSMETPDRIPHVMGMDQHNHCFHNLGDDPKQELLRRIGAKTAHKMYVDKLNGESVQVGYIIKTPRREDLWVTLYNLTEWERPA